MQLLSLYPHSRCRHLWSVPSQLEKDTCACLSALEAKALEGFLHNDFPSVHQGIDKTASPLKQRALSTAPRAWQQATCRGSTLSVSGLPEEAPPRLHTTHTVTRPLPPHPRQPADPRVGTPLPRVLSFQFWVIKENNFPERLFF